MHCGVALDLEGESNGSMGVDIVDFDNDGDFDLWAANYEFESFALYRNQDNGYFRHYSNQAGISRLGDLFVGFGTAFFDADLEGDEDVVVANGHVVKYPTGTPLLQIPLLLENVEVQGQAYFNKVKFIEKEFPGMHIIYHQHVGSYNRIQGFFMFLGKKFKGVFKEDNRGFGIYYDNPE